MEGFASTVASAEQSGNVPLADSFLCTVCSSPDTVRVAAWDGSGCGREHPL